MQPRDSGPLDTISGLCPRTGSGRRLIQAESPCLLAKKGTPVLPRVSRSMLTCPEYWHQVTRRRCTIRTPKGLYSMPIPATATALERKIVLVRWLVGAVRTGSGAVIHVMASLSAPKMVGSFAPRAASVGGAPQSLCFGECRKHACPNKLPAGPALVVP